MRIEKEPHNKIKITGNDGGFIESQTVEANILYEILDVLKNLLLSPKNRNIKNWKIPKNTLKMPINYS